MKTVTAYNKKTGRELRTIKGEFKSIAEAIKTLLAPFKNTVKPSDYAFYIGDNCYRCSDLMNIKKAY